MTPSEAPRRDSWEELGLEVLGFRKNLRPQPSLGTLFTGSLLFNLITKCHPNAIYSAFSPEIYLFVLHFKRMAHYSVIGALFCNSSGKFRQVETAPGTFWPLAGSLPLQGPPMRVSPGGQPQALPTFLVGNGEREAKFCSCLESRACFCETLSHAHGGLRRVSETAQGRPAVNTHWFEF